MRTNKWVLVSVAGAVLLVVIIAAVLAFMFFKKDTATIPVTQNQNPFGTVSGTNSGTTASMTILLTNGSTASVPDFTKDEQPSWAGPTGYRVAGTDTGDYLIVYVPSDGKAASQFLLTIFAEPIGAVRKSAEAALRNRLLLTDAQLCATDVTVATGPGVSDTYEGTNLGLSFCPGSVKLP